MQTTTARNDLATAPTLPAPAELVKTCACGAEYTSDAWHALRPVRWELADGEVLEMARCRCGSHITIQVVPPCEESAS